MEVWNLFNRNIKWRFQNPVTIMMTLIQPLVWLLLFSVTFQSEIDGVGNYTVYLFPGILVMSVLFGAGMSGIANYSLKSNGSFYRIFISPVKRRSIILGHILDIEVTVLIQTAILTGVACLIAGKLYKDPVRLLLAVFLLFVVTFFTACVSYILSMIIPEENGFIAVVNTMTLPLFFLSTALVQAERITNILKYIIIINPYSYAINSLRNLILDKQVDWENYGTALLLFAGLSTAGFILAKNTLGKGKN